MAINFHPIVGQILYCDFTSGFQPPEMIKKRPVIILSPKLKHRDNLTTIIPISSVEPSPVMPYHFKLDTKKHMPMIGTLQKKQSWAKCDMIYTVAFNRLNLIRLNIKDADGKRIYFNRTLPSSIMDKIRDCVKHGLGLI